MGTTNTATGWVATDSTFGARLALVRQAMGWGNTKEAALACGLPVQSWRGWERDNRQPRDYIAACRKIAERTGCDVYWLAGFNVPLAAEPEPTTDSELPRVDSNHQPFGYRPGYRTRAA